MKLKLNNSFIHPMVGKFKCYSSKVDKEHKKMTPTIDSLKSEILLSLKTEI